MSTEKGTGLILSRKSGHWNYFGFNKKSRHSDMTLEVGGVTLYVNKVVLEMASPCLQEIFDEKLQDGDKQEITLEDHDVQGFIEFLACIYPGYLHEVEVDNVFRILPLACKYNVNFLKMKSETLLTESLTKKQPEAYIYQCLSVAKQHSITSVEERCMELLVDIYKSDIQRADEILTLKADVKPVVTYAMIPLLRSEASKYRFLTAGPKCRDIDMDLKDFHDAKYSTVQFQVNHSDLVNESEFSKTVSSFHVWGVNLNIEMRRSSTFFNYDLKFVCKIFGCTCVIAAKMAMKNNIPGKDDVWKQNKGDTELYIAFTQQDAETEGIRWHDKFTIVAHVLINKPTFTEVDVLRIRDLRRRSLERRRDGGLERQRDGSLERLRRIHGRPTSPF